MCLDSKRLYAPGLSFPRNQMLHPAKIREWIRTPPTPSIGKYDTTSTVDGACCGGGGERLESTACDEILDAADVVRHESPDLGRLVVGKKPPAVEAGAFRVVT